MVHLPYIYHINIQRVCVSFTLMFSQISIIISFYTKISCAYVSVVVPDDNLNPAMALVLSAELRMSSNVFMQLLENKQVIKTFT